MTQSTSSYLICASQRSGSTMVCRALTETGIAGRPEEYFLAEDPAKLPDWRFWEEGPFGLEHGVRDRQHYLETVLEVGTTENGVFGAKLNWNNLRWAIEKFRELPQFAGCTRAEVLHRALPNLHVIHVLRQDRVRQAVSWSRMAQDGVWIVSDHEPAQPTTTPEYRPDLIAILEQQITEGEADWRRLFHELRLEPLVLYYEDMITDEGFERAVIRVLDHLPIKRPRELRIPARRTRRQADATTEDWVRRFHAHLREQQ
jgi:trehalose 2-sulfotransferase